MERDTFTVSLDMREGYQFDVDFGLAGVPPLKIDEPPPLGAGTGPNAARVLAASVGGCLTASLLFCLRKSRVEVKQLRASVEGELVRNERGRLRVGAIRVQLDPMIDAELASKLTRCKELFEDFCLVTQSVRQGIDIEVAVSAPAPANE
ncbi:MAG: OsmC family protein [Gemmatimonadales bacterium]